LPNVNKLAERKQTCRKQTGLNVQRIYRCRQYGRRFMVTCDI